MVEMPKEVVEALADFHALKVVATVAPSGMPNAVIVATVVPIDRKTICFADLRLGKTKENLTRTPKFTIAVIRQNMESYQIRCSFTGYEERGGFVDTFAEEIYKKIKMQPRGVVTCAVEEVYSASLTNPGARLV
jgi:predicted pyridoxine 5'-phosphate oxidase superfamily flavin-nucleotide-binding protein